METPHLTDHLFDNHLQTLAAEVYDDAEECKKTQDLIEWAILRCLDGDFVFGDMVLNDIAQELEAARKTKQERQTIIPE